MLTLSERERIAYITQSPEAALLILVEHTTHDMTMRIDELAGEIEIKDLIIKQLEAESAERLDHIDELERQLSDSEAECDQLEALLYCATDELASLRNAQ